MNNPRTRGSETIQDGAGKISSKILQNIFYFIVNQTKGKLMFLNNENNLRIPEI